MVLYQPDLQDEAVQTVLGDKALGAAQMALAHGNTSKQLYWLHVIYLYKWLYINVR